MMGANTSNMVFSMGAPVIGLPLGPGIGEVFHLVASVSDYYNDALRRRGVPRGRIFTSLTAAHGQMVSDRGDTLIIYPGSHVQTASLTWSKNNSVIIGVGSPNQRYQPSTLTSGGVRLTCVTSAVAEILNITGHYVQMYNIGTQNTYSGATNYCDVRVTGKNFYAENCVFRGGTGATQIATDGAGVPVIFATDVAGGANAAWFNRCQFGSSGNTARTKGPSCARFVGGAAAGFGIQFTNCVFSGNVSTEDGTDNACLIHLVANYAVDRELLFDGCLLYNFKENNPDAFLNYAIKDDCGTTHSVVIKNSMTAGCDAWTSNTSYLVNMGTAIGAAAGGLGNNG